MVLIAGVVGFFLSIFAAFFMEYIDKSSLNPENKERMDALKNSFAISAKNREWITNLKKYLPMRRKT
jgi:hypothetical protein